MDALLLALVLTLALDQGTASQRLAARFGDAGAAPVAGLALMVALNATVAAAMGGVIARLLGGEARLLFLAIALLFGALGQLAAPFRKPHATPPGKPRLALLRFALRRAGENGAFAVAGVTAFTNAPILAAAGAMLGGWAALAAPLALGTRHVDAPALRLALPLCGLLLLCAAMACAVNALRLT